MKFNIEKSSYYLIVTIPGPKALSKKPDVAKNRQVQFQKKSLKRITLGMSIFSGLLNELIANILVLKLAL